MFSRSVTGPTWPSPGTFLAVAFCLVATTDLQAKEPKYYPVLGGICIVDKSCSSSIAATCAQLHCRAQAEDCDGDYSSGECKDIKELHTIGLCESMTEDCGSNLPGRFGVEALLEEFSSANVAVLSTDPDATSFPETSDRLRDEVSVALGATVLSSVEIGDHSELAGRLGVTPQRAARILTGPGSARRFSTVAGGFKTEFSCSGAGCVCVGDADCNDMFATVCSDPAKAAVCLESPGGGVVCGCSF